MPSLEQVQIVTPEPWINPGEFEDLCYYVPWYRTERFRRAVEWEAQKLVKKAEKAEMLEEPCCPKDVRPQPLARPPPTVRPGTIEKVKEPKRESLSWFPRTSSATSDTEALYLAFLIVHESPLLACDQVSWANSVEKLFRQGSEVKAPCGWKPDKKGAIIKPLWDAYWMKGRSEAFYDTIGKAIQIWEGDGQFDKLRKDNLKQHQQWASQERQRKSGALVSKFLLCLPAVASLVKQGVRLRWALKEVNNEEEPQTLEQRLEVTEEVLRQAQAALQERSVEAAHAKDALRKHKERSKEQRSGWSERAKEKLKKNIESMKAKCNSRIKATRHQRLVQAAREKAEKESAEHQAELKRRLAKARARARDKENAAKLSTKRLKRAQKAEAAVKELQAALEEEPSEGDMDEDERPSPPRTAEKSRRDERGRFRALPNHVRVLIWAQLARRVAPSAVNANITDAIRALTSPENRIALPCEREINKMRGELTIASEAIAAFRVALCKRIISFGWDESTKFGLGLLSSNTQIEPHDAPGVMCG